MTLERDELVRYLNEMLDTARWEKLDASLNGLQVEGADRLESLAFTVDACAQTIGMCVQAGAGMLIAHHGLFWGKPLPVTGAHRKRVSLLLESGISLYTAHLPLDFHPVLGHNACIARGLGLEIAGPLALEQGLPVGLIGQLPEPAGRAEFAARVNSLLDTVSRILPFGPDRVQRVGIVSGSGSSLLVEPLSSRIDTFITGESSHTLYHFAREFGVNVLFAGHYASETPGLRALESHLKERFDIRTFFLEAPTGL